MTIRLPPWEKRVKAKAYIGEPNLLRPAGHASHYNSIPREDFYTQSRPMGFWVQLVLQTHHLWGKPLPRLLLVFDLQKGQSIRIV